MLLSIFWDTLLPIFLIIATGFILMHRFGVDVRALSLVAFYLFLPCLMFTNLLHLHLVLTAFAQICLVHFGMLTLLLVCAWMIAWLQAWERPRRNAFMMTSIMQNVGNYGLPISQFTSLNLSEFVDGRGWSIYGSVRLNEAPRFARDWLENREEIHSA